MTVYPILKVSHFKVAVYRLGVAAVVSKTARYPARIQN